MNAARAAYTGGAHRSPIASSTVQHVIALRSPSMNFRVSPLLSILAFAVAGCASMSAPAPAMVAGGMLAGPNGMTLYTFDRDVAGSGKSVCNGPCAANWPPLMAGADTHAGGDYSVIMRDDGGKQVAYKGKPLYYWAKDAKPGDKTGDGFNNVWHVVKP
jgi:predicted lipoprotein with Yx(FWY)xxD motif